MISQLYLLSKRCDVLVARDFRGELSRETLSKFFRKVSSGPAVPVFCIERVNYIYIYRDGVYVLATSPHNVNAALVFEVLETLWNTLKEFCGIVNENTIRKNFSLVYEIIDELLDFGYPQETSVGDLLGRVLTPPILSPDLTYTSNSSLASHRPITVDPAKNEVFLDVIETMSVLTDSSGKRLHSRIAGHLVLKSYMPQNTQMRLALDEQLDTTGMNYTFHQCVGDSEFQDYKMLSIVAPFGQTTLMSYWHDKTFALPVNIFPHLNTTAVNKLEVSVQLVCTLPSDLQCINIHLHCVLPKATVSAILDHASTLGSQSSLYNSENKTIEWWADRLSGQCEGTLRLGIMLKTQSSFKEVGPISLQFEVPKLTVTPFKVSYLKVADNPRGDPVKWVRLVTRTESYACRIAQG